MTQGKIIATGVYAGFAALLFIQAKPTRGVAPRIFSKGTVMLPDPSTRLSEHDEHIERASEQHKVDWRFTAALISVESSFNARAKSKVGAIGLMQVMPVVFRELNAPIEHRPEDNIAVGLTYFKKLRLRIKANSERERILMTLAAYNAGLGHLRDAQRLAKERGLDPLSWNDLRQVYPTLEDEAVHAGTKHGYCQGRGIVRYAEKIMVKYRTFRKIYPMDRAQYSKNAYLASVEQYRS